MEISIGQNLRQIRKKYGIRQHEISGGEVTRNLISLIENDKTPLHDRVAKLIAKNINEINEQKNNSVYVDYKDLLEPKRVKAKEQADVLVNKLKKRLKDKDFKDLEQDINDIELFFEEWSILEKKAELYELLGDIFYLQKDRINEYSYYTKAFEACFSLPYRKKKYELVLKLGATCIDLSKYEEAIRLNSLAINSFDIYSEKVMSGLYFNSGLAYKKMNKFDEALKCIHEAESYLHNDEYSALRPILILKGNCYKDTHKYDEAIKTYKSLISILEAENDYENLCIVYINIADLYKEMDLRTEASEYKDKVMSLIGKVKKNSRYIVDILFELALVLKYLDDIKSAEKLLLTALEYSELNTQDKKKSRNTYVTI
jgi:tetratricopeptide (TPR) repeat protein